MIKSENGIWEITEDDIRISKDDLDIDADDGCITVTAYVETWFDVDERFGTETYGTSDYINLYARYDTYTGNMELVYHIWYADGNVSDEIPVESWTFSEERAIFAAMKKAGMDELINEIGNETEEK